MDSVYFPTISSIARRDVLQTSPDTTIRDSAELMRSQNLTSVAYTKNGTPYVFTIEHVLTVVQQGVSLDRSISELAIPPAATVHENQTVLDAMEDMDASGSRYLAVVDSDQTLIGIVTYTDIVYAIDPVFLVEKKTVGEVVKRKELIVFSPDWILDDVLCHLTHVEDCIIIVDDDKIVGILTSKDAFRIILSKRSTDKAVSEYMTSPVVTVKASAPLHEALTTIKTNSIKRAVVVDDQQHLVGVVTQSELVGFAYGYWTRLLKHHSGELRELVTMLSAKADKYRNDSLTDPLTGLGNRRLLSRRIKEESERVRRYGTEPFSFLLLDVDRFKSINDQHGHTIGDEVLKALGRAIQSSVRTIDAVGRWGGDEFAVLAPHTRVSNAMTIAARILNNAESLVVGGVQVTISIGVGEIAPGEQDKNLFDRVDRALLDAKRAGRNRIEVAETA